MQSIICQKPQELILSSTSAIGECPPGCATISIKRIGICGTDFHAFLGKQPFVSYPRVLGHELAGVIKDIEPHPFFSKGDRVAIIPYLQCHSCSACLQGKPNCCEHLNVLGVHQDGGMREEIHVPIDHLLKTNQLSFAAAALIEPLAIGAHAIQRSHIKPSDRALIIGAGPIGLGAIAFAKQLGVHVTVLDRNESRLSYCKDWLQVDKTITVSESTDKDLETTFDGQLPPFVFDATGNAESMMKAFDYVSHGGTLTYIGLVKQHISFNNPTFHSKELTLLASRNAIREDFEHVARMLEKTSFEMNRFVTHTAPLNNAIPSFIEWMQPETHVIKAQIIV